MECKRIGDTYLIRVARGEEIAASIVQMCTQEGVNLASVSGIGAADRIVVGLYDVEAKEYTTRELAGQHEVTGLIGNITLQEGKPHLHAHITVTNDKFEALGGHLESAVVSGTFEGVVRVLDGAVERKHDPETGLALWRLE